MKHWKDIGRLLKIVDRALLDEWVEWSRGFGVSYYICNVLWDSFEPIGCDVHTSYFSLVRQALSKVLRPGLDYKAAAERMQVSSSPVFSTPRTELTLCGCLCLLQLDEEDSKIDKRDLKSMLTYLGIRLNHEELRMVMSAFRQDEQGKIRAKEFVEFTTSDEPSGLNDTRQRLHNKCVWESACPKCGLSKAFRVVSEKTALADRSGGAGTRIRTEPLAEQRRRLEILRQFQEIPPGAHEKDETRICGLSRAIELGEDEIHWTEGLDWVDPLDSYDTEDDHGPIRYNPKHQCTVAKWLADEGKIMRKCGDSTSCFVSHRTRIWQRR